MELDITPVAASDEAALTAWCAVTSAALAHDSPLWREHTPEMIQGWIAANYPGEHVEGYLAYAKGQAIANLRLTYSTRENLNNLLVDLRVVPDGRRHGLGSRIHDFVLERAAALHRTRLISTTLWELPDLPAPSLDGARFAERLGYRPALADVARRLELCKVDDKRLDSLLDQARARSLGYSLVRWTGPYPEEHIGDLAYLESRLFVDMPTGDLAVEAAKPDPERLRQARAVEDKRGRLAYHTAAVHEATGKLVAWTTLSRDRSIPWSAFQQITIVEPEHRGHRLGALVKVENLRYFREAEPTITAIDTFNAAQNGHMIAINEAMGFKPLYAFQNWQREI
jgi:GNAT superfamily N-acetyltransferase